MSVMDDLRDQIKFRGLKQGGFSDPVREFKGRLDGFDVVEAEFQGVKQGRNNIVLHFSELDVIECTEGVYQFPIKDVTISYSEKSDSRWGIFATSGLKFLTEDEEFRDLIGRRLHLRLAVHKLYQGKEKGVQPAECWEIVGVEGAEASSNGHVASAKAMSTESQLLILINGHTQQQFCMEALKMDAVKKDSSLSTRILNKTFFAEIESNGLVKKDEAGIYTLTDVGVEAIQG